MTHVPPPVTCGIYRIFCLANDKVYIGSSINIEKRWREHRQLLHRLEHPNNHLQNAWCKYGSTEFEFKVLEVCPPDKLIEREQCYLDAAFKYRGYVFNATRHASASARFRESTPGSARFRYILTSPEGVVYEAVSISAFCREHPEFGLNHSSLSSLTRGKIKQHFGWTGTRIKIN